MSRASANMRFVYGSNCMGDTNYNDYDINDMIDYNTDDNSYCNNDCMDCVLHCPYKEY